jgi:predicted NBD/HSP70 family sugar kinase
MVLRLLRDLGPRSRAGIAAASGLGKPTVSSLVADLTERGLVRETGFAGRSDDRRVGRPATLVELDGSHVAAVGVELNVDYLAAVALDLGGRVVAERRRLLDAVHTPRGRVVSALARLARETVADAAAAGATTVAGLSVAVPGVVDQADGRLRLAPNLGWRDVPVLERLQGALEADYPIVVDNEANFAALAEHRLAHEADNLVCVIGETGVGAGILINGRLLRGVNGASGEVGHMAVVPDGLPCGCGGHGCWETVVGLRALLRAAVPDRAAELEADVSLSPEDKVAVVTERAEAGDAAVLAALDRFGYWLGLGAANLANLFNPEVIVLTGFYRQIGPWVRASLDAEFASQSRPSGGCRIELSALELSPALGGALLAADRIFDDPTLVSYQRPQRKGARHE